MEYKVGSLANLISGTHNASSSNKSVVYIPFQSKNTTSAEVSPESATSPEDKRKGVKKVKLTPRGGETKWKEDFSKENAEEEAESEEEKPTTRPPKVRHKVKIERDEEQELRTIFVKNIPHIIGGKRLKKIFKQYGTIECIRFRCAPQSDTRIPKKVTVIKKDFHPDRSNICAFIRFNDQDSVEEALKANGSVIEGHHIFIDRAVKGRNGYDQRKAIFLGNVPFAAEENEIWTIFEKCGEIQDIRIVRDRETGLGKGFAFVNFKSSDAVELAMTLEGVKLREKELRVMRVARKLRPTSNQQKDKAFTSKKKTFKRTGPEGSWGKNKKNPVNNTVSDVKEKSFLNKELVNRTDGKKFKSRPTNFNRKVENKNLLVESKKQHNTSSHQFQGQKISDKKRKKKKINKNDLKKKIVAKKLSSR